MGEWWVLYKIFLKKEIQGKEEVWQENGALVMSMLRWRLPRIDGRRRHQHVPNSWNYKDGWANPGGGMRTDTGVERGQEASVLGVSQKKAKTAKAMET